MMIIKIYMKTYNYEYKKKLVLSREMTEIYLSHLTIGKIIS